MFDYKNWTDNGGPSFLGWHNQEIYVGPEEKRSNLYVGVPEWWGVFKPCQTLGVPTSPMFAHLRLEFVDGRQQSSSTIRGHLYRAACLDCCVAVLIAFHTHMFSSI